MSRLRLGFGIFDGAHRSGREAIVFQLGRCAAESDHTVGAQPLQRRDTCSTAVRKRLPTVQQVPQGRCRGPLPTTLDLQLKDSSFI